MSSGEQETGEAAFRLIDQQIRDLKGWRGKTLARISSSGSMCVLTSL